MTEPDYETIYWEILLIRHCPAEGKQASVVEDWQGTESVAG